MASLIYIDEASGNDDTGTGTQNAPYKTLAYALFKHDGADNAGDPPSDAGVQLQLRKDATAPYDKPTDSALKKAKKGAEGLRKKQLRAAENAEREARARADVERKLEESKKIVLVEDPTLPKAVKVRICIEHTCIIYILTYTLFDFMLCSIFQNPFLLLYAGEN